MIAVLSPKEVSTASAQQDEYSESQVAAIATASPPPIPQGIRKELDGVVSQTAQTFKQAAQMVIEQALVLGRTLLSMKKDLNRNEYQIFLQAPGWTSAKANKYIKLAKTFEGFSLDQIGLISLDTLFTLCGSQYQELVAKLREMSTFTQELVERLMKESRLPKESKQQQANTSGWKQNPSGGGRYYQVLLHDEETGVKIEELAKQQQVLPQRVISDAVRAWYDLQTALPNTKTEQFNFSSWEEIAVFVKRDRNQLLSLAKGWTSKERTSVVNLFSRYLENYPDALNVELEWVPKNLLDKALSSLSFSVQIGGTNSPVDDPKIEYIKGCRFVSLDYPGTRNEQWIFADDNKLYPVFGRDEFVIEKFRHS